MLKSLKKKLLLILILSIAWSCSTKSKLVSNGCEGFCDLLILPEISQLRKDTSKISVETFSALINMRAVKRCGCIVDNVARDKCFNNYIKK